MSFRRHIASDTLGKPLATAPRGGNFSCGGRPLFPPLAPVLVAFHHKVMMNHDFRGGGSTIQLHTVAQKTSPRLIPPCRFVTNSWRATTDEDVSSIRFHQYVVDAI